MKKSEQIKKQIANLELEYKAAKLEESQTLIYDDKLASFDEEYIGFFNLTKAKNILRHLNSGNVLLFDHQVYGKFKVYMNAQRNCISVQSIIDNEHIYSY